MPFVRLILWLVRIGDFSPTCVADYCTVAAVLSTGSMPKRYNLTFVNLTFVLLTQALVTLRSTV